MKLVKSATPHNANAGGHETQSGKHQYTLHRRPRRDHILNKRHMRQAARRASKSGSHIHLVLRHSMSLLPRITSAYDPSPDQARLTGLYPALSKVSGITPSCANSYNTHHMNSQNTPQSVCHSRVILRNGPLNCAPNQSLMVLRSESDCGLPIYTLKIVEPSLIVNTFRIHPSAMCILTLRV